MERISNSFEKTLKLVEQSSDIKTFGIIIYDKTNPEIVKLLRDDDYWDALHAKSGDRFTIFAIKPEDKRQTQIPGMLSMLTSFNANNYNELINTFDIDSKNELPLFIIFTKYENRIHSYYKTSIDDSNIDIAKNELLSLCKSISNIAENIHATVDEHETQVNDKFKEIIHKHNFKKGVAKLFNIYELIRKYVKFSSSTN